MPVPPLPTTTPQPPPPPPGPEDQHWQEWLAQVQQIMVTVVVFNTLGIAGLIVLHGDPHLATLDGLSYDLQAVGEFHLLQVPSAGVDVQARFKPWGSSMTASVLDSVAFELQGHQIGLHQGSTTVDIDGEPVPIGKGTLHDLGGAPRSCTENPGHCALGPHGFSELRSALPFPGRSAHLHDGPRSSR